MPATWPDSQTLIAGLDVTVVKMLAKSQGDRPLLKQLQQSSFDNDILVEFQAAPLLAKLPAATGKSLDESLAGLGNPALAVLAKDLQSVSIKLNFGGTLVHAEVVSGKPESASMMLVLTNVGLGAGEAKFEAFEKNPPPIPLPPPLLSAISKVGDDLFAGLTVKADGAKLVVDLPMPESLPELMKQAAALGATAPKMNLPIGSSEPTISAPCDLAARATLHPYLQGGLRHRPATPASSRA